MNTPETAPKTASITLKASGATMRIVALRRRDGTAVTFVATTDADKKTSRGMTEQHPDMATATTALAALAAKAQKLGWEKRSFGFKAKPDAFSALPAAPKARK